MDLPIGRAKFEKVVQHIEELFKNVEGLQVNFMIGTDADEGDEPFELTKEFIKRTAFAWPTMNIPTPFAGTTAFRRSPAKGQKS